MAHLLSVSPRPLVLAILINPDLAVGVIIRAIGEAHQQPTLGLVPHERRAPRLLLLHVVPLVWIIPDSELPARREGVPPFGFGAPRHVKWRRQPPSKGSGVGMRGGGEGGARARAVAGERGAHLSAASWVAALLLPHPPALAPPPPQAPPLGVLPRHVRARALRLRGGRRAARLAWGQAWGEGRHGGRRAPSSPPPVAAPPPRRPRPQRRWPRPQPARAPCSTRRGASRRRRCPRSPCARPRGRRGSSPRAPPRTPW